MSDGSLLRFFSFFSCFFSLFSCFLRSLRSFFSCFFSALVFCFLALEGEPGSASALPSTGCARPEYASPGLRSRSSRIFSRCALRSAILAAASAPSTEGEALAVGW